MYDDNRDIAYVFFLFCFGIWYFFRGFKRLRRKRKIENIPTSTVRGLAMGLAEIIGKSKMSSPLKSPFTGVDCVFYRYTVERYKSSGKSGRWVIIAKGDSSSRPFWLEDETGKILVFPQRAELIMPVDYGFQTGWGRTLPANLVDFMQRNNLSYSGLFGNYSLRFKEWHICEDERTYVLGTAASAQGDNYLDGQREKLMRRLEELKSNAQEMAKLDLNKDGKVSLQEWDLAVSNIEQRLIEDELKLHPEQSDIDGVINKGNKEEVFIISDYSQKELIGKLSWQAFSGVFGGAALALTMLAYLLFRLSGFRF